MGERTLADVWAGQAQAWAAWSRTPGLDQHFERYNWPAFAELLPSPRASTLDLGCGEGRGGVRLRALGHRLTGVDASAELARLADATGAYERMLVADAARLPFADGAFDLVVAFMSLQDMDDAPTALREAARVLVPGGRLAAAVVHPFESARPGSSVARGGGYFEEQRTVDTIERAGVVVAFDSIHRPLAAWFALLSAAGFALEDLREPRPTAEDVRALPRLAEHRARPLFLHLRCVLGRAA